MLRYECDALIKEMDELRAQMARRAPFSGGITPSPPPLHIPRPRGNPLAPLPSTAATKLQVHYKLRIAQLEFEKEQRLLESREVAREKAALNIPGLHLAASSVLWNTGRHGELRRKA